MADLAVPARYRASDDWAGTGAFDLAAAIAEGWTSARQQVDLAIARIEALDDDLNAVVVRDFDRARAAANAADAAIARGDRKPLLGVPMTVKEAFDVAGLPTTWGYENARDNITASDAVAVRRLKAAGAVILGKTNVPPGLSDWQSTNPVYGRTRNPFDPERSPGGSSGGSAVALATGMVPLELGSDIGGSIRIPAHFCGVWGHKPTYGYLDPYGHRHPGTDGAAEPLGVIGPMARNAADLAVALDILADHPLARAGHIDPARLRILLIDTHPGAPTDPAMRDAVASVGAALASEGARVETSSDMLPDLAQQHRHYLKMLAITFARGRPGPGGQVATLAQWFDMRDIQARNLREWGRLFECFDAVITPPDCVTAFRHRDDDYNARRLTIDGQDVSFDAQLVWPGVATYPGLPATAMPVTRDTAGLPVGVQVICDAGQDHRAVAIADLISKTVPAPAGVNQ